MAKIITFGIEKGGAAKTTTCGIIAHLLSQKNKVLVIDMDSQGNVTELLTMTNSNKFRGKSILEAIKDGDISEYRLLINDNLHLVAGQSDLAMLTEWLCDKYPKNKNDNEYVQKRSLELKKILQPVIDEYDYILIDTPPALSYQTTNALAVSDFVCIMFETSQFCHAALERFFEQIEAVKDINPKLKIAGIIVSMIDNRRSDNKLLLDMVKKEYPQLCFKTVITRRAATGRIQIYGFKDNPELKQAVEQFEPLLKELKKVIKNDK